DEASKHAVGSFLLQRINATPVNPIVRHAALCFVPGSIFQDSVPGGVRYRQDTARLTHRRGESGAIIRPANETKERIVGGITRVNSAVKIMDGGYHRAAQSPRRHCDEGDRAD